MKSLDDFKAKFQALYDKIEDKETIQAFAGLSEGITNIEKEINSLEEESKSLLKDYKEVIKHTSLTLEKEPERGASEPVTFESLFDKALAEQNNKK